jgi:PAS domain S-box-containing protein
MRLARFAGLGLTLAVIAAVELLGPQRIGVGAPATLLLLAVAFSANRGGTRIGLASAALAGLFLLHLTVSAHRATAPGNPITRATLVGLTLIGVAFIVGRLRQRLDRVTAAARAQRTMSEQELAGAQEAIRFQARLLDAVGQAVIAVDLNGRITYANRSAGGLYGCEATQLNGRPVSEAAPAPDSQTALDETLDRLRRGSAWVGESVVTRADGTAVPVLITDSPLFDDRRNTVGMVRVLTDLQPRRRAEDATRTLAEAGRVLAASLDYESTLTALSRLIVPALADCCLVDLLDDDGRLQRLEAAHVDAVQEARVHDIRRRYPLTRDAQHPAAEVIRTGRSRLVREVSDGFLRSVARDDEHLAHLREMAYRSALYVPLSAGGRTFGALTMLTSVSGRRYDAADVRLAEEIARRTATAIEHARLYEESRQAGQAKSDFLAVMSHELRTPLTTIMGYADLMLGGLPAPLNEQVHAYVQRLRGAAAHLLGLIDQILVYSRLERDRLDTQADRVTVADLLRDVAALIEPVANERGLTFRVEPPPPLIIETDLTRVRQILLNLLANAVKFTDAGEVTMWAYREDGMIVFAVRDTGIGIEPENLHRVFDAFWQVDQSATRRAGGVGLGLSVSRRLARLLGGDLSVESEAGQGTTFFLRLPERWHGGTADTTGAAALPSTGPRP